MGDIKKLKKVEDIGWEVLRTTGMIDGYGMVVSARELQLEKQKQENRKEKYQKRAEEAKNNIKKGRKTKR